MGSTSRRCSAPALRAEVADIGSVIWVDGMSLAAVYAARWRLPTLRSTPVPLWTTSRHGAFFNVHLLRSGQKSLVAGTKMRLRHALATSDAGKGAQSSAVNIAIFASSN